MFKTNLQLFAEEFDINLQLFANDPDPKLETDPEIEPEIELEQEPESELDPDPETDPDPDPDPEPEPEPAKDVVPLSKYMAEKKKRQDLEKIFATQEAEKARLDLVNNLISQGYPQPTAEFHANSITQQQQALASIQDKQMNLEIKDLARSDAFFADAESFKDDIKAKMNELNIDAESAYMVLRGSARTKEMKIENQQTAQAKRAKVESKKVPNATVTPTKNPYPLDADDKKALAELQKAMPDVGWTAERYFKTMKM